LSPLARQRHRLLAERLPIEVIAEGIKTVEDRDLLAQRGCRCGAGYRHRQPPTHSAVTTWLRGAPSPHQRSADGRSLSAKVRHTAGMTGTPADDNPRPPWADHVEWLHQQIEFIDRRTAEIHATMAAAHRELQELHARGLSMRNELALLSQIAPTPRYPPGYPPPPPGSVDPNRPETSTRTVQNVLFVLGGLLLGTAAIAFTAVAWATFGETGRAAVLATVTLIMLAIPLLALARGLQGTAETFAAVGLLLVVLDGYALWYIDIGGVQSMPGLRYAGAVALVTAGIALAYRLTTRLTGPGFAALVLAQPALVLLVQPDAGWVVALVATAVAAFDIAVIALNRAGLTPLRVLAWIFVGLWLASAALSAAAAESMANGSVTDRVHAGTALVVTAVVFLAAGLVAHVPALLHVSSTALVIAVAAAVGGVVATAQPNHGLLLVAAVATLVSLVAAALAPALPVRRRTGPRVGAVIVTGAVTFAVAIAAARAAVHTVARSLVGELGPTGPHPPASTWELPAAALLVALGFAVTVRARTRVALITSGGLLAIVSLPDSVALPWWAPAPAALAAAALALSAALAGRTVRTTLGAGACGAFLLLFAILTAQTRPALSASILAGVTALGFALTAAAAQRPRGGADRLAVGGSALAISALSAPAAVGEAVLASGATTWWAARASVIALAVPIAAVATVSALHRRSGEGAWPAVLVRYAYAGLAVSAIVWPTVAIFTGRESRPVYAAVSLVVIALGLAVLPRTETSRLSAAGPLIAVIAAAPGAVVLVTAEAPAVLTVVGGPYAWLSSIWSGAPSGVGVLPTVVTPLAPVTIPDAVALAVLAFASAAAHFAAGRSLERAAVGLTVGGPTAVIVGLVAAGASWPAVPAATVLIGLILVVVAGVAPLRPSRAAIAAGQGLVYCGAGLAGALSTRWSTLVWLGAMVVGAAVLAGIGRTPAWRVSGWLGAAAFSLTLAATAGFAAALLARQVSFAVLGAALLLLFAEAVVERAGRPAVEIRALRAAGQAGGVVALLFTVGFPGYASAVSVMWGIALGLRALVPGTAGPVRARVAATGAGFEMVAWWLLLWARAVTLVEAYTLPLSLVALLAGWAALRARPDLRSWVAYGPALAAGFLPSLAMIISVPGSPGRRLALGAAAIVVVVLGSITRRQAPVVIGGLVLVIVALHELVLLWQLLPGWIPLAAGGVLLVGLAITYERRRRDLARLRTALGRMT
jgi:hypothetical protein